MNFGFATCTWSSRPRAGPKPGEAVASETSGPSFMMALQEQLGSSWRRPRGGEFLVIDRVERPLAYQRCWRE